MNNSLMFPALPPLPEGLEMTYYTLDAEHNIVPTTDVNVWYDFSRNRENKRVAATQLSECWVSTVFLSTDHGCGEGPPILLETMAFKGRQNDTKLGEALDCTERYATWDEAVAGHETIVKELTRRASD